MPVRPRPAGPRVPARAVDAVGGAATTPALERFVAAALASMPDVAIIVFDPGLRIVAAFGASMQRHGYDPGALVGRRLQDVLPAVVWGRLGAFYSRALQGETVATEVATEDGDGIYLSTFSPIVLDGALRGGMVASRDVTAERREQQAARQALERSERDFRTLAESSTDIITRNALDGALLYASPSYERLLGRDPHPVLGTPSFDRVHPDDRDELRSAYARAAVSAGVVQVEFRLQHADGHWVWFDCSLRALHDPVSGEVIEFQASNRDITRRRADEAVRRQWALSWKHTMRGVVITDPAMERITAANPAFAAMHGRDPDGLVGTALDELLSPRATRTKHGRGLTPDGTERFTSEHRRSDGTIFPVAIEMVTVHDDAGRPLHRIGYVEDLTASAAAERARREASERFERAFADAPIGMALVALDGRILRANHALVTMTGHPEAELVELAAHALVHPDDVRSDAAQLARLLAGELPGAGLEQRWITADGETRWVMLSRSVVRDDDGRPEHVIAQVVDITERRRVEQHLHHLADHDPLTGLWNRRRFGQELERRTVRCRRSGERAALLLFDLDGFKYINDTFGHKVGDDLLVQVARIASARSRPGDGVGRLGGDEFALLLGDVGEEEATAIAEDLCRLVAETPLIVGGEPVHATMSAGVALLDRDATTGADAFVAADVAMYDAKHQGRDRAVTYAASGEQRERLTTGLAWSQRLRRALEQDDFVLEAQPIVELASGRVALHELLVRLRDDDGTLVGPDRFLASAGRFGFLRRLDRHVIGCAAELAASHPGAVLSVNLSGRSVVDPTLGDWIEQRLAGAGCAPAQLVFEVTETEAIANMEQARALAERLRELGCRFALDDFGSGFASFYHLKALPLDLLKIDGEFVRALAHDRADQLVVEAVQHVAQGLGKDVVAEHVEDAEAAAELTRLGVRYAQGFFFGAPGDAATMLSRAAA